MIMHFRFNEVSSSENVHKSFNNYVNSVIKHFIKKYNIKDIEITPNNAMHSLTRLLLAVKRQNGEIYLIVDEVDSFMNYMLLDIEGNAGMSDSQLNEKIRTSAECKVIREWGNVVKNNVVKRMLITGVIPVALAEGRASLNIVRDITCLPQFANMFGFTQRDVERALYDCFEIKGWKRELLLGLQQAFEHDEDVLRRISLYG